MLQRAGRLAVHGLVTIATEPTRLALNVSQAADRLGVSIATVRRWSDAGHLPGYRTPGGQRRFTVEQLDGFVDSLRPAPPARIPTGR